MTLKRNELLISEARSASVQDDWGEEYGLDDEFFIKNLASAVQELNRVVVGEAAEPFADYEDIAIVSGQDYVEVPEGVFIDNLVYEVRYAPSGTAWDDPLRAACQREYDGDGYPEEFFVDGGKIYMNPMPTSGTVRVRFERALDVPDLRRGQVSIVETSGGRLTRLVLSAETLVGAAKIEAAEWICVSDSHGRTKMRNIEVLGFNSGSGEFTFNAGGFAHETGEAIAVGDWVTLGRDSTTHVKLPQHTEGFFLDYLHHAVLVAHSSNDVTELKPLWQGKLDSIAELYSQLPAGRH